jgi:metal-dependent amidase/aminoacylase/carboxypeptidase family protein
LDAIILFFNNINALRQQLQEGIRVHGIIIEAGKALNVIPDAGRVRLEWRSADPLYFN